MILELPLRLAACTDAGPRFTRRGRVVAGATVVKSLAVVSVAVMAIGRWPRDRMASPSPAAVVGVRGSDVEMKLSSVTPHLCHQLEES